jgi:hypothetical protein
MWRIYNSNLDPHGIPSQKIQIWAVSRHTCSAQLFKGFKGSEVWSRSCIRLLCNMLGQRQERKSILLFLFGFFVFFCFCFYGNPFTYADQILLESRAVKDIKKACFFNMEINLPPKIYMLCPMKYAWWMYRNLCWILHFAAEFDACVNKVFCPHLF